jgi:hypothetical protein
MRKAVLIMSERYVRRITLATETSSFGFYGEGEREAVEWRERRLSERYAS